MERVASGAWLLRGPPSHRLEFEKMKVWKSLRTLSVASFCALVCAATVFCLSTVWITSVLAYQSPQSPKPPESEGWIKVEDAMKKGLPKTAIEQLGPIIDASLENKRYAEAVKGIAKRIVLETQVEGRLPEEGIRRMDAQIENGSAEIRPILQTLQAHYYWTYFQQNRWRFAQRSSSSSAPGPDFTTWDLKRLFEEIEKHYSAALAAQEQLQAIPIATYNDLLPPGTLPDRYRPTLFDFVAFEALEFYNAGEQAGAKAQDALELEADSALFGSADDFLAWKPVTTDEKSTKLQAIRLYQKLLRFHANDDDRSAYLDADLARLQFGYSHAVGDEKWDRYLAALKRFANAHALHELSAEARHRWARLLMEKSQFVEARSVAQEGVSAHPESAGGKHCANLIAQIEAKSIQITTERVWSDPPSAIRVQYKNMTRVHFRLYAADWKGRVRETKRSPVFLQPPEVESLLRGSPVRSWNVDLPATEDFKPASLDVDAPTDLPSDFYYLVASPHESFGETNNVVSVASLWVTNLGMVLNQAWNSDKLEGFVVDNRTGLPVAGATVMAMVQDNRNRGNLTEQTIVTNDDGRFAFSLREKSFFLIAQKGNQQLAVRDNLYVGTTQPEPEPRIQCVLFTDRSLFRPGQTVQFKGVCMFADPRTNRYNVVPNHTATVSFRDMNGNEIGKQSVLSNDFGSFSGLFQIPRDRGTGMMSLQVEGLVGTTIQVEEYKRPKFLVELATPDTSPKLNEPVVVPGNAKSYTGVSIQNAKVSYRVTRAVRWPIWFSSYYPWRIPPQSGEQQEIAHGTTTTDADGKFQITFVAKPDRSVAEQTNPIFRYEVVADITDSTGETRTDTLSVSVGYVAMEVGIAVDEWLTTQKPVSFVIKTTSLDGKAVPAAGKLKVFRLIDPQSVMRPDVLGGGAPVPRRRAIQRRGVPIADQQMDAPKDMSNIANWEQGELVSEKGFEWSDDSHAPIELPLGIGSYRAIVETKDRFGKPVEALAHLQVIDPAAKSLGLKIPHLFRAEKWRLEPGETFRAVWGTGYESGQAYVEVLQGAEVLQRFWTKSGTTQIRIEQAISEGMRGGLQVRVMFVRENRCYLESRTIDVPWTNKDLKLRWERLVSKLEPGKKEKFKLIVEGPKASKAISELVAAMYDASLDAYYPHQWTQKFNVFRQNYTWTNWVFQNNPEGLMPVRGMFANRMQSVVATYREFPSDLLLVGRGPGGPMYRGRGMGGYGGEPEMRFGAPAPATADFALAEAEGAAMGGAMAKSSLALGAEGGYGGAVPPNQTAGPQIDLEGVSPRKNLAETAFFLPHVTANADGGYELEFTVPEALTSWRIMAFSHDRELKSGYLESKVVTTKDLMVEPNPPRFLREGDIIEFSVKVSNTTAEDLSGKVALKLSSAMQDESVDAAFGNGENEKAFTLKANESKSFAWRLQVPDESFPIIYRAIGSTGVTSDGEEGMLPVLSKRILVTESLPLPIRGKTTKEFELKKLLDSAGSDTIKHQSVTVQMVSQPSWYAVLSLPYLMEYPHQCSEQTFNRLYANTLANHIAMSDPKIRRVLDVWKNLQPDALRSPLEKNEDLKSVLIQETPWLRDAQKETEARRNVGLLFDETRLASENARAMKQLIEMQNENGMWPWFPGGPDNEYLSLYIVTGFGRLKHLGTAADIGPAVRALHSLDSWMKKQHDWILTHSPDPSKDHLSSTVCLYLYGRSFFMNELPVAEENQKAFQYWQEQARKYWLAQARQSQGHIAIGLHRLGDRETPMAILKSITEFSTQNEEMGMFWRDQEQSWWWYRAPIETQALMIEAFDEVAKDAKSVEECKVWLLKQKQTQNWKTTKSTADAIYALLLRGTNLLASDALVEVEVGGEKIEPQNVEAGTGFYEEKFVRREVKPEYGKIKVTKTDEGVSWGSVHWQYLEDINKVTPWEGTPLKLEKQLYKKVLTKEGPQLVLVDGPVEIGDELVCRIVLRVDRDMEYVHLKDHRGSGTEPVNVLSQYKYQDGLGYYESTRDTASHFFIDYLSKGTYVFEYSLRVQHAGKYPSGLASIECMYAPEFNSHSGSVMIEVRSKN